MIHKDWQITASSDLVFSLGGEQMGCKASRYDVADNKRGWLEGARKGVDGK
jgi:hypothetical protein